MLLSICLLVSVLFPGLKQSSNFSSTSKHLSNTHCTHQAVFLSKDGAYDANSRLQCDCYPEMVIM